MPRCMSRIAPGKLRSSSKAKALSARTSLGAELSTPPPVLVESMPAVAVPVLAIPVSHPFGRCRSREANPRCRLPSFYHFVTFVTRADVSLRSRWSRGRPRRDQGGLERRFAGGGLHGRGRWDPGPILARCAVGWTQRSTVGWNG